MTMNGSIHLRNSDTIQAESADEHNWVVITGRDPATIAIFGTPETLERLAECLNQCAQMMREKTEVPANA